MGFVDNVNDKADLKPANLMETAALLQAQCQQIEDERANGKHNLREREKQLGFLCQFFTLAARPDLPLDDFIREILDLIPTLWQHPDETSARIFLYDQEYRTTNFIVESEWKFSAEIGIEGQAIGSFEIFYVEGYPEDYEGLLIWEDSQFLHTVVNAISLILQRNRLDERYQNINDQYQNIVLSHQELENRISSFVPKLKLMNEKFQKTLDTKNRFIKQIGHEILHQIDKNKSGFEDSPTMGQSSGTSDPLLDRLICLGEKVEQLVDYEVGNFVPENKPFSIRSMLAEVLKDAAIKVQAQKVDMIPMINPLIPDKVSGDGKKLKQIVSNLIDYSLEIGQGGQVIVKVELEASAHLLPIYSFSITLRGCDESETEPSRILRLNAGLGATDENDFMISRLGVVISRQLVELMGGEIWIEGGSDVGGRGCPGISFQFTTWLDIDKTPDERTYCLDLPDTLSYHILVADQNPDMCEMLREYFSALGFAITIAGNGAEACKILEEASSQKSEWVVAIVDAEMTCGSDQNLLNMISEKGWLRGAPIILTGPEKCRKLVDDFDRKEVIKFAQKPFDFWHFDLLVRQVLEKIRSVEAEVVKEAETTADEQTGPEESASKPIGKEMLGIVSPDKVTRIMLSKILEKQNYDIEADPTFSEIEEAITTGKIDALLIDLHPNLSEPDKFVHKIRMAENFTGKHLPIIIILSPESDNSWDDSLAAGADRVVNIGEGYDQLCDQIRLLLDEFRLQNREKETPVSKESDDGIAESSARFDRLRALKLANDDLDLLLELLEVFDEEADDYMSQMKLAVQLQKSSDLSQAARALEHSSSNIGAIEIKRLSAEIIDSVQQEGLSNIGKTLQDLQAALEAFAREVASYEKSMAM